MNELNENNLINNPKSIVPFSSIILLKSNDKKRLSLSVNKSDKSNVDNKLLAALKKDINNEYNKSMINELYYKIKKKDNDIEKVKKQIEIAKRNMKYYDNIIKDVDNLIHNEEHVRKEYQLLINFFINLNDFFNYIVLYI